jgi:iron complex outermembrane receptor protein
VKDYSLGLDAFRVEISDVIRTGISTATILGDPVRYSSYILRGTPDGNASGVGSITGILQSLTNLGKTIVGGVDVDLKARVVNTAENKTTLRLNGTYISKYDQQNLDGSYTSAVNQPSALGIGVVLRWRHTASATWESGAWAASLSQNYQVGYHDLRTSLQPASVPAREVASYQTFDAQLGYTGIKSLRLALGVKNLLDKNPPYTNYGAGFVGSYDLSYTDVRGRFVYMTAAYAFK